MNDNNKWRIWSIEHNAWWGPDHCGYVRDIHDAGIYTLDEAVDVCKQANQHRKFNFPPDEAMVPA